MFKKILKGLYMILFIISVPLILAFLFSVISKDIAGTVGIFSFLYISLIYIQYFKFGYFNPLKLFEIKKDES